MYTQSFFSERLDASKKAANDILSSVSNHQTALRLFARCTLHQLPHLLGSEVLYCFSPSGHERWDDWTGQLSIGISLMVEQFLSALTQRSSIPRHALLISYMTIAQGGLGLMDASTHAMPNFVLTM